MEEDTEKTKEEEAKVVEPTDAEERIVREAKEVATQSREAEELKSKNLDREEKLLARKEALAALGGGSVAGDNKEVNKQTDAEYTQAVMDGKINGTTD